MSTNHAQTYVQKIMVLIAHNLVVIDRDLASHITYVLQGMVKDEEIQEGLNELLFWFEQGAREGKMPPVLFAHVMRHVQRALVEGSA